MLNCPQFLFLISNWHLCIKNVHYKEGKLYLSVRHLENTMSIFWLAILTDSSIVEHAWQNQHDMIGPILAVQRHFILFDHKKMEVVDAFHSMIKVQETMLMAPT